MGRSEELNSAFSICSVLNFTSLRQWLTQSLLGSAQTGLRSQANGHGFSGDGVEIQGIRILALGQILRLELEEEAAGV